jgi:hypothetical protein
MPCGLDTRRCFPVQCQFHDLWGTDAFATDAGCRVSNPPWFFIVTETVLDLTIIQWRTSTWDDTVSKAAWEPELHLELPCWILPISLRRRLSGFNGGLSVITPEPEVHFELLLWSLPLALPRRDWWRLSGCDGSLSTMTWELELELHLEWIPSTVLFSCSCTGFWLMHWRRLVILGGVGGDLKTWLVNCRLVESQFGGIEIVSR